VSIAGRLIDRAAQRLDRKVPQYERPQRAPRPLVTHWDLPDPYGPDPIVFGRERYWERRGAD
jgi:hypothetical protein